MPGADGANNLTAVNEDPAPTRHLVSALISGMVSD
jgi:hypothetical protein